MFSEGELNNLLKDLDNADKLKMFKEKGYTQVLAGTVITPGKAVTAVGKLVRTFIPKTTKGKVIAGGATVLGAGAYETFRGGATDTGTVTAAAAEQQAVEDQQTLQMQLTLAQMQASGVDVQGMLNTPIGQQILNNPGFNTQAIFGANSVLPVSGVGVYVGPGNAPAGQAIKQPTIIPLKPPVQANDVMTLADWKKMFPLNNPKELAAWKKKLVDAGVVSSNAGLADLQKQWENWGQFSLDAMRNGSKLTPYQLLDIQRGLWGGGGEDGPSYSLQLIKTENAKNLYKQYLEGRAGRIVSDAEAEDFAKFVRDKQLAQPTKTEVKKVKGKKVTVTTPGFGEAEAAAAAEQRAMQDPLYKEFQTANVFGTALEKALGVRG